MEDNAEAEQEAGRFLVISDSLGDNAGLIVLIALALAAIKLPPISLLVMFGLKLEAVSVRIISTCFVAAFIVAATAFVPNARCWKRRKSSRMDLGCRTERKAAATIGKFVTELSLPLLLLFLFM